jgi:alkaline phosphatase D
MDQSDTERYVMESKAGTEGSSNIRRREFLVAGAAAGLTLAAPINYAALARARNVPVAKGGKFLHGVSAGFPTHKGVTLWTRISELDRTSKLTLEIAKDKHFRQVVKSGQVTAKKNDDFTIHERINGLKPHKEYFYRFETQKEHSRVGKFRTLPAPDSKTPLKVAFLSCQDYEAGYYNAHKALAKEDLDLYIFLGDYVYEHRYYPGPDDRVDTLGANGDGDVQTLDEYRQKYHQYQADPDLQALQASHAFVNVWDDHEVEDNYAGDTPDSKEPNPDVENDGSTPRRVPYLQRRKNGYKAFFESMPRIRKKGDRNRIYGSVRLGALGELFLTDQRQYRDPQPCGDALLTPCPEDDTAGRTMLGEEQKNWFKNAVPKSDANWKLWGSEVMLMSLDLPQGQHVNPDGWDGYGAERKEILEHFVASGVKNLTALTGDIHTFFAGDLTTNGEQNGTPVGVELVGGSVTSLGIPESLNQDPALLEAIGPPANPHIKFFDLRRRGFGIIEVGKSELKAEFRVCDALNRGAKPTTEATFTVESGVPTLNQTS